MNRANRSDRKLSRPDGVQGYQVAKHAAKLRDEADGR